LHGCTVTRTGVGLYTILFSASTANMQYAVVLGVEADNLDQFWFCVIANGTKGTNGFHLECWEFNAAAKGDPGSVSIAVFV
jgi:hypothetical protein